MTKGFFEMFTMIKTHPIKHSENKIEKERKTNCTTWENLKELILFKHILYTNFFIPYIFMEISTILIKMFRSCKCEIK